MARRRGLTLDAKATVRIGGACIVAVADPSRISPVPGVLVELRFRSPSGERLHRFAVGKPSVEEAMVAALDFVVAFSRAPVASP
jgi:hypothetical protein